MKRIVDIFLPSHLPTRLLSERALKHAAILLALCAVVFFFLLCWMSWLQQELTPPVQAERAASVGRKDQSASSSQGREAVPLASYQEEISADLFGISQKKEQESEEEVDLREIPLSEKDLDLELVGTIIHERLSEDLAIIEDTRKNEQDLYKEGDKIDQIEIKEILRNNVVIVSPDGEKVLTMEYKELREDKKRAEGKGDKVVKKGQGNTVKVSKNYVLQSLRDMSSLMQDALIKPYLRNGETVGFQLNNIKSDSIYEKLGLQDKDVVLAVDDTQLNSPQQFMEFAKKIQQKNQVKMTLIRNGREREIKYNLQ